MTSPNAFDLLVEQATFSPTRRLRTDAGVFVLTAANTTRSALEDLAFHGDHHSHHPGGFSACGDAVAIPVPFDGAFDVSTVQSEGRTAALVIDLSHVSTAIHDVDDHLDAVGEPSLPVETQGHGHEHEDGWSEVVVLAAPDSSALLGDPVSLLDQDYPAVQAIGLPAGGGVWHLSTHTRGGVREYAVAAWVAAP